jgi:hypothetical protein
MGWMKFRHSAVLGQQIVRQLEAGLAHAVISCKSATR